MMLTENIRQAFRNFKSSKMRTLLSLLGITIGVAAVILITTLGKSAALNVQKQIASQGMDIINVYKGWPEQYKKEMYDPKVGDLAADKIGGIKRVTPVYTLLGGTASSRSRMVEAESHAVRPDFFEINRLKAVSGNLFPTDRAAYSEDKVILGYKTAQALFPEGGSTGQKIILNMGNGIMRQYEVYGVLVNKDRSMLEDFNNSLYIPYENYNRNISRITEVERWVFQAEDPKEGVALSGKITTWFRQYGNDRETYFFMSASSVANTFKSVTGTLNIVLGSIAAISLIVGGIGIMNIMLVSVTERIREIGIRMSLGASPNVIRQQFLAEAVSLTFIGGLLGILFGSLGGWVITKIIHWSFAFSPGIYLISAGYSIVVGLFFGLYPAIQASKLNPIDALSHE